jgi:hypothetical protein
MATCQDTTITLASPTTTADHPDADIIAAWVAWRDAYAAAYGSDPAEDDHADESQDQQDARLAPFSDAVCDAEAKLSSLRAATPLGQAILTEHHAARAFDNYEENAEVLIDLAASAWTVAGYAERPAEFTLEWFEEERSWRIEADRARRVEATFKEYLETRATKALSMIVNIIKDDVDAEKARATIQEYLETSALYASKKLLDISLEHRKAAGPSAF